MKVKLKTNKLLNELYLFSEQSQICLLEALIYYHQLEHIRPIELDELNYSSQFDVFIDPLYCEPYP